MSKRVMATNRSKARQAKRARGPAGRPGPAGPPGEKITPAEILAVVDKQFMQIQIQLDIQLKRIAQVQQQLDEVQSIVKDAVGKRRRTG